MTAKEEHATLKICSYKQIKLGDFYAKQFTLFECKYLFSVIFYWFVGDGWQDRYHDHAFRALSLRLWGSYQERVLVNGEVVETPRSSSRWRYFPRDHMHMLGKSKGCLVVLFAGPWLRTWREIRDGVTRTLTWGRRRVEVVK